jgi:hypothetical protein
MSSADKRETHVAAESKTENAVRYPENNVVAVIDTLAELEELVESLTGGGFLKSEIQALHGQAAAEKLRASTGRSGLAGLAMRLIASIGMPNDETAMKNRYAQALADGRILVLVEASTDERKKLAAKLLREHGGKFVNFLGRYTIEPMIPPRKG